MIGFEVIDSAKVLARTLICQTGIKQMQVVSLEENRVEVCPFSVETANTVFEEFPVAVILQRNEELDRISDLAAQLRCLTELDLRVVRNILIKNKLFYKNNADTLNQDVSKDGGVPLIVRFKRLPF